MLGKSLYPDIAYFTLLKELPLCNIGDQVTIIDADGRECLTVNGIDMPIDTAKKSSEWFIAVTLEEHRNIFKNNTIKFYMEKYGVDEQKANEIFEIFLTL